MAQGKLKVEIPDHHVEALWSALTGKLDPPTPMSDQAFNNTNMSQGVGYDLSQNLPLNPVHPQASQDNSPNYAQSLRDALMNPPLKANYEPSRSRKAVAAITGGLTGAAFGPSTGMGVASEIADQPYQDAFKDWMVKSGALEKGFGLDTARTAAQYKGVGGLAQLINAQNRGDVGLQDKLAEGKATAQEGAKKTNTERDYEYYQKLKTPEEKESFENMLLKSKNNGVERLSGSATSAADAQYLADTVKKVYRDKEGNVIDVHKLLPGMELVAMSTAPGNEKYSVNSQRNSNVNANNEALRVSSLSNTITPLGVQVPPTSTIDQPPGIDVTTGEAVPGQKVTARQTGPVPGQLPAVNAPGQQAIPPNPQVLPPQTNNPPKLGRQSNIYPYADADRQTKISRASGGLSLTFGDPKNPNAESLSSFSKLANNPEDRKLAGKAINLIMENLAKASPGGEAIGASIGGTGASASLGGLITLIKNKVGLPGGVATSEVEQMDKVFNELAQHPEVNRYVNTVLASYGSLSSLRSLNNNSAYQFAMTALEREIPLIGINTSDEKSFNNKLALFGRIYSKELSKSVISKNLLQEMPFWNQKIQELENQGQGKPGSGKYTIEEVDTSRKK